MASFTGDGAYDEDFVYTDVTHRHPDAAVVVPPRATAVPSETAEVEPTQRDRHLQARMPGLAEAVRVHETGASRSGHGSMETGDRR
jgi:hypothetical protein